MARGLERPPAWAVIVMLLGLGWLVAGGVAAADHGGGLSEVERTQAEQRVAEWRAAQPTVEVVRPVKVTFIGDSYSQGSAAGWPALVGDHLGFAVDSADPGLFAAQGGTGYLATSLDETQPFGDRLDPVFEAQPDLIVVAGGINDGGYPPAAVGAAAGDVFGRLRAEVPNARIVVVGPFYPTGETRQIAAVRDAIFEAASTNGITDLVDPLPWFGPNGVEIGPDGTHPTDAGQAQIAERMTEALRPIVEELR